MFGGIAFRGLAAALVLALVVVLVFTGVSAAFESGSASFVQDNFGQEAEGVGESPGFWGDGSFSRESFSSEQGGERQFSVPAATTAANQPYFVHEQPIKLAAAIGVTILAIFLLLRGKNRYRKIVLVGTVILLGFYLGGFLCPLAAVQNVMAKWSTGYLFLFLAVLVAPALVVGRVFCGWVCPFGAVQELLHVRRLSRRIPERIHRYLAYVPYGFLVYLVLSFLVTGHLILLDYTPFKAVFTWDGVSVPLFVSVGVALLSITIYRPFCQYACPLGALLGLISRISVFGVHIHPSCTKCRRCEKICPVGAIELGSSTVRKQACIVCGRCIDSCRKGAISLPVPGEKQVPVLPPVRIEQGG